MVAYSFKKEFEPRIKNGSKRFTIRGIGKRVHASPGIQFYTGMRTPACRKVYDDQPCKSIHGCVIGFARGEIVAIEVDGRHVTQLELFAQWDGFDDLSSMTQFWADSDHVPDGYTGKTDELRLINWAADMEVLFLD